jgi:hypothetical protein
MCSLQVYFCILLFFKLWGDLFYFKVKIVVLWKKYHILHKKG